MGVGRGGRLARADDSHKRLPCILRNLPTSVLRKCGRTRGIFHVSAGILRGNPRK